MITPDSTYSEQVNRHLLRAVSICRWILTGTMLITLSACKSASSDNNLETFYVDSTLQNCHGVIARKCMRIKTAAEAPWQLFYSEIEGFSFEPGFRYILQVKTKKIENPPADASSITYQLIEIEQKIAD